jgi:NADH:ubiquinone oxidoreductase subunit 4 (subunit M)
MFEHAWLLAAFFLPLFPLGMVFNALYQRIGCAWMRILLLMFWPLVGLVIIKKTSITVPDEIALWALFSAALYGFRAVVIREVNVWIGFLATSSWSLVWVALATGVDADKLLMHVIAFNIPLVLLLTLVNEIESRYESAYAGVVNGLAQSHPRLSGVFVITLLAAIGSPLFPAFFAMINNITHAAPVIPTAAIGVAVVWLLWSWSGMQLLQELLVGPANREQHQDMTLTRTTVYSLMLVLLVGGGLYLSEIML